MAYNLDISIFGKTLHLDILLIAFLFVIFIVTQSCFSCYRVSGDVAKSGSLGYSKFEGFTGTGAGPATFSKGTYQTDTDHWGTSNLSVVSGEPLSQGVQDILNREPQPVPLPEGELSLFATTPFKPECCPNTYSNSSGCACMTVQQYNYIVERGGNNVPYSEY